MQKGSCETEGRVVASARQRSFQPSCPPRSPTATLAVARLTTLPAALSSSSARHGPRTSPQSSEGAPDAPFAKSTTISWSSGWPPSVSSATCCAACAFVIA
eukprot:5771058-Prymnesium_polylepis.1